MELGPQNHNRDGLLGPNFIRVMYMDPLGETLFLQPLGVWRWAAMGESQKIHSPIENLNVVTKLKMSQNATGLRSDRISYILAPFTLRSTRTRRSRDGVENNINLDKYVAFSHVLPTRYSI